MDTPIYDFVRNYAASNVSRMHMPGHKGKSFLGCEDLDITEVAGADSLYEADGIIARSEANASSLFGTGRTLYSTEGSSQCIRAMLHLALLYRRPGTSRTIAAARNVHKAFVYAAALLDFEVVWLWPESDSSLCSCPITAAGLERTLSSLPQPPAAVYVTSPDYLGGQAELPELARVCAGYGSYLLVDNAHGAYLRFLNPSQHPMDLGADLCCDSAHKTLPVLTGGAYLHMAKHLPQEMRTDGKQAMALFGSTSPSYLTLASLDRCNALLSEDYPAQLNATADRLAALRRALRDAGWQMEESDPLRITIRAPKGITGHALADQLRKKGVECEFSDPEYLVLMLTASNDTGDLDCLLAALGENKRPPALPRSRPTPMAVKRCTIRQAVFSRHERLPVEQALGRICGSPSVSCPPAVPVVVSGEEITSEALERFQHYHINFVDVVKA